MSAHLMSKEELAMMYVENELLKLVDEAPKLTRSDLQGRAWVAAKDIIRFVKDENAEQGVAR